MKIFTLAALLGSLLLSACAAVPDKAALNTSRPGYCDTAIRDALDRAPAASGTAESVQYRSVYLDGAIPFECRGGTLGPTHP